jgi:arylsulfate sulfotransferase
MTQRVFLYPTAVLLFMVIQVFGGRTSPPTGYTDGPTPFISFVHLRFDPAVPVSSAEFTIRPKLGSQTRPVHATFSSSYLEERGYLDNSTGKLTVPVFGLYAGRTNRVTGTMHFTDGTSRLSRLRINTAVYDGGTYSNPVVIQPRLPGTTLSYDFILLKNYADAVTPIIIDTDGEVRWISPAGLAAQNAALFDNAFYVTTGTSLYRTEFDGVTLTVADYSSIGVTGFHHNIDPGREGMLLDVDTTDWTECVNLEVDKDGNLLRTWNFAKIIGNAMTAGGDDRTAFIAKAPNDWFHNNATSYRASDNSLISSSRENFVIAVDYDTQQIKWILGDPTKHWYQFASLQQYSLTLIGSTLPPIGQHAVSVSGDQLLLFDDGANSLYQQPPGENRDYSAVRKYDIDLGAMTATEVFTYRHDPDIYSPYCSSAYEDAPNNYVIDYTLAGPYIYTGLVGLDADGNLAFEYHYDELDFCGTAWNAIQIHWEDVQLN